MDGQEEAKEQSSTNTVVLGDSFMHNDWGVAESSQRAEGGHMQPLVYGLWARHATIPRQ